MGYAEGIAAPSLVLAVAGMGWRPARSRCFAACCSYPDFVESDLNVLSEKFSHRTTDSVDGDRVGECSRGATDAPAFRPVHPSGRPGGTRSRRRLPVERNAVFLRLKFQIDLLMQLWILRADFSRHPDVAEQVSFLVATPGLIDLGRFGEFFVEDQNACFGSPRV